MEIAERNRLEQEIQKRVQEFADAEAAIRSVVDHVVDGIISIDEQGIITTFNPAAEASGWLVAMTPFLPRTGERVP